MLTRVMLFIINTLYPRANLNLQLLIYFHGLGFWFWYFLFYYCRLFTLPVFVVFPPVLFCRRCSSLVCLVFCSFLFYCHIFVSVDFSFIELNLASCFSTCLPRCLYVLSLFCREHNVDMTSAVILILLPTADTEQPDDSRYLLCSTS